MNLRMIQQRKGLDSIIEPHSSLNGERFSNAVGDEASGEPDTTDATADDLAGADAAIIPRLRELIRAKKDSMKATYGHSHWVGSNKDCATTQGLSDLAKAASLLTGTGFLYNNKHCKGWRSAWKEWKAAGGMATLRAQAAGSIGSDGAPAGYLRCASENETITLTGTKDVAFGASGKFVYKKGLTGSVTFNTTTFGDPLFGTIKSGYCKDVAAVTPDLPIVDPTAGTPSTGMSDNTKKILIISAIAGVVLLGAYFGYQKFVK